MFVAKFSLTNLFEIDARRQAEMDDLFQHMGRHPSKEALLLLQDTASHSYQEGKALLEGIKDAFRDSSTPLPRDLVPKMFLQLALLPKQIATDKKLLDYLTHEYQ